MSKNISIKMLKDVGMIVPKSRETSAVYMQQDRRGSIYAARQGMRACNNTNMGNPIVIIKILNSKKNVNVKS